jgi:hypothetical protein
MHANQNYLFQEKKKIIFIHILNNIFFKGFYFQI